ncbi:ribonuclease III domain-containing protein [Cladorrhinum sp. PSN259]|nr:ribonuclease III domain-containing protein [Cladorrhinum sp. PSN259]
MSKRNQSEAAIGDINLSKNDHAAKKVKPSPPLPQSILSPSSPAPTFSPTTFITPFTSSTIPPSPESYPPLPPILDPALATAALTHSGLRKKPTDLSYERLEWIGDVYMELIASELIYTTFPQVPEGKISTFREMLTRNSTLAQFSLHYGLDKLAKFPAEFDLAGRVNGSSASTKKREKTLGDIFEAYVGALVRSDAANGYRIAVDWLKALWGPVLKDQIREQEKGKLKTLAHEDTSPKTKLEQAIAAPGVKIEYKDLGVKKDTKDMTGGMVYTVGCFLNGWGEDGLKLGWGSAKNKKEAGQKAAVMALGNQKLMKRFREQKEKYAAVRAKQREQEEEGERSKEKEGLVKEETGV